MRRVIQCNELHATAKKSTELGNIENIKKKNR